MKKTISLVSVLALGFMLVAGCDADKSGETRVMPETKEKNSASGVPSNGLPPQAQAALQNSQKGAGK